MERYGTEPSSEAFLRAFLQSRAEAARAALAREGEDSALARLRLQQQFKLEDEARGQTGQAEALTRWMGAEPKRAEAFGYKPPVASSEDFPAEPGERVSPAEAPTMGEFMKQKAGQRRQTVTTYPGQRVTDVETGETVVDRPYESGEAAPPEQWWKYERVTTTDNRGKVSTRWQPKPAHVIAHMDQLWGQGIRPGTREWEESVAKAASPTIVVPGVGATSRSTAALPERVQPREPAAGGAPGQTQPKMLVRSDTPASAEATMQLMGVTRAREAASRLAEAVSDPQTVDYMGKMSQYRLEAQRWAQDFKKFGVPMPEKWTKIPEAITRMEQDTNTLKNYTIRLITGAQMNLSEATRIEGEIPNMSLQPSEYNIRLRQTLANTQMMERMVIQLALGGNQRARLVAEELGLPLPKSPAGVSGQPSGQPAQRPVPLTPTPQSPSGSKVPSFGEWKKSRR